MGQGSAGAGCPKQDPPHIPPRNQDVYDWYHILRRPPATWSAHEVATWAGMRKEYGGGQLGRPGQQLETNCIDGHLLLSLNDRYVAQA